MQSYHKLQDLLSPDNNQLLALNRMAEKLVKVGKPISIQFNVHQKDIWKHYSVISIKNRYGAEEKQIKDANIEISLKSETLDGILCGKVPPVKAFFEGKMRFRGDEELALEIVELMQ